MKLYYYFSEIAKSIKLFSSNVTKGTKTRKCKKYKRVENCPNSINGDSTCFAPNCNSTKKLAINM